MMSSNFPGRGKFQAWYGIARHMGKLRTVVLSWNTDSEGTGQKGIWNWGLCGQITETLCSRPRRLNSSCTNHERALSTQGGTWPPKLYVRTITLLNITYSNQTLLQILNLDLIKHLDLRLLPNSPGLDLFPRTNVSLYSLGGCWTWEQETCMLHELEALPTQYTTAPSHR